MRNVSDINRMFDRKYKEHYCNVSSGLELTGKRLSDKEKTWRRSVANKEAKTEGRTSSDLRGLIQDSDGEVVTAIYFKRKSQYVKYLDRVKSLKVILSGTRA